MDHFTDIYETMLGLRDPQAQFPGVENAFAEGSVCARAYAEMEAAYRRLSRRMGNGDPDLDTIVNSLEEIQKELCRRMFYHDFCRGNSSLP